MKKSFLNKHNYNLHKSEDYFCIPSVLYTILISEYISFDFNKLVNFFVYYLPEGYDNINIEKKHFTKNEKEWGIKLEKDSINNLFKEFQIPLKEDYIPINTLNDWNFVDVITENLNSHIVFGYDYSFLYKNQKSNIGHVSIINDVLENDLIEILNPGPLNYGSKIFDAYSVFLSIKQKKDGLWIISRTN